MLTIREAINLLSGAKSVGISWGGCITDIDPTSELEIDAYGSYIVTRISSGYESGTFELQIAMKPLRAGAQS